MNFAWPQLLWLLLAPVALLGWELTHRRRAAAGPHPKIIRAEAGAHLLEFLPSTSRLPSGRRPRVWLAAGLALGCVALARPQWGHIEEPVFDQSREILIAIDLSRSMLSQDVKPSRLERAKLLVQSLLERLEGERVGLVVFSGTAFLQSPLSADYEILREFLPALGPDYLPEGGTNYSALLETALQAFSSGGAADRFLIVLSDGEATDDDWHAQVADFKKKGIRVIGLGIGTPGGAMIPDGTGGFVKDDRGAVVLSKLENGTLQELAQATQGAYRDASAWVDLSSLLQATIEAGRKGEFLEKNQVRFVERFQWALAPALLCLLLSFWREFPVRPKPRELALSPGDRLAPGDRQQETGDRKSPSPAARVAAMLCLLSPVASLLSPARVRGAEGGDALVAPLAKVVGRLAGQNTQAAPDWAELARTTVTYGQHLQSAQEPVPEGPVRDALAAVAAGRALDARAADWPQLRTDLEALLQKPEEKKTEPPPAPPKQPEQNQSEQQKQDQSQQKDSSKQPASGSQNQQPDKSQSSNSDQQDGQKPKPDPQKNPQSAFGDMKEQPAPKPGTPPPGETQKVGGNPENKSAGPADADPSLALPLQKLDQLRNQDSPAKLFQLMDSDKKTAPKKNGKDW